MRKGAVPKEGSSLEEKAWTSNRSRQPKEMDANVQPFLWKMRDPDEKAAVMQEFGRQMLDSYHYSRNTCTKACFSLNLL